MLIALSVDAIDRHADSVFDKESKQIHSTNNAWIQNSLALDDEYNYTNVPNDNAVEFITAPQLHRATNTPTFQDNDSVHTFCSKVSVASTMKGNPKESASFSDSSKGSCLVGTTVENMKDSTHSHQRSVLVSNAITLESFSNTNQDMSGITDSGTRM